MHQRKKRLLGVTTCAPRFSDSVVVYASTANNSNNDRYIQTDRQTDRQYKQ